MPDVLVVCEPVNYAEVFPYPMADEHVTQVLAGCFAAFALSDPFPLIVDAIERGEHSNNFVLTAPSGARYKVTVEKEI